MTFYGHGILILKGKRIRFTKQGKDIYAPGKVDIEDEKIADAMIKLGYQHDGEIKKPVKPAEEKPAKKPAKVAKDAE